MRNIQLAKSTVKMIVQKAVMKRYRISLPQFLADVDNGTASGLYPRSEDLVELTRIFRD